MRRFSGEKVSRRAAGDHPLLRESPRTRQDRDAPDLESGSHSTTSDNVSQVPEEAEPSHVCRSSDSVRQSSAHGPFVEGGHAGHRFGQIAFPDAAALEGGAQNARPKGLGQDQSVSWLCGGVGEQAVGMGFSDGGQAHKRLKRIHRVSPHDRTARAPGHICHAGQHFTEEGEGKFFPRPSDQAEREQRRRTHGVEIAQRIGSGDPTPGLGIVNDRGEKVHRGDQGAVRAQTIDRRIVPSGGVDEDVGVFTRRQMREHLCQLGGAQLAGTPGAVREGGEPDAGFTRWLGGSATRRVSHGDHWSFEGSFDLLLTRVGS